MPITILNLVRMSCLHSSVPLTYTSERSSASEYTPDALLLAPPLRLGRCSRSGLFLLQKITVF